METTMTKESRLNIRCDNYTRQLLDKAASYVHVSISEFVRRMHSPQLNVLYKNMSQSH